MLTKSKENELNIFDLLTIRDSDITELTETLELTPRTLKEHVRKLNEFAKDFLGVDELVLNDFKGNYSINPEYLDQKDTFYGYLKMAAYKTSTSFQIVLALILNDSIKKNTLAKRMYISQARVTSLVNQLNEELQQWDFQIGSNNGELSFIGREISIRLYSYVILTDAYAGLKHSNEMIDFRSPFHYDIKTFSQATTFPDRFATSTIVHLQKVISVRLAHHHVLPEPEPDTKERVSTFFSILEKNYDISRHINSFLTDLSPEEIEIEKMTFNYFSRLLFSDFVPVDKNKSLITKLLDANAYYATTAKSCICYLNEVGFLNQDRPEIVEQLIYFLTIYLVYFDLLGSASSVMEDNRLNIPDYNRNMDDIVHKELTCHLRNFADENKISFFVSEREENIIIKLLTTAVLTIAPVSLNIYIQTDYETAKRALIIEFLRIYYNPQTINLIDTYRDADLIVTDNIGEFPDGIPVLFFKSTTSREQWNILTDEVRRLLFEKMK